ncbi:alpha/beta hydrolase [Phenylobacterium sp. LjRoot219]|uniref:alpha/beta fold hydrolase n=1 Tax=Phenylobacterium sp. LjRoot219 TaxID=3342283 RepID=UPI003ED0BA82
MSLDARSQPAAAGPADVIAALEARARRCETPCGDGSLVWRAWGSGPPLLLLHGSHGSWAHWIRSIEALSATRTVWAPDLPGNGDSALPPSPDHPAISAALAAGLRQLIGDELPLDIVGFSLGGVIAAHLAALHPALVRRLILVDTGGLDTPLGTVETARARGLEGEARRAALRTNLLAIMLRHPASVDALALHLLDRDGPRGRLKPVGLVLPDKLLAALPQVTAQVDAIWGEFDGPHPDPTAQEAALRGVRPDLEFRVIPNVGHWVMYEDAETFNRTVLEMLARPLRTPPA